MWHNNKTVVRTYTRDGTRMAWAIIQGVSGWLRIRPSSPDGVTNIFVILCAAQANGRHVNVFIQNNQISQATLV